MQTAWLARGLGIALVAAAFASLAFIPEPVGGVAAMGLAAVGLFVGVVVAERAVPASAMQAAVRGEAEALESTMQSLRLQGVAHGVAGSDGRAYLFLPARDEAGTVPAPESGGAGPAGGALHGGQDGHMAGLSLPCAATHLLASHAGATSAPWTGAGLEASTSALRDLGREHDLWSRLDIQPGADATAPLSIRLRPGAAAPPCRDRAEGCLPAGCLLCHCVTLATAQGLEQAMRLRSGSAQGGWVRLELEKVQP